MRSSARFRRFTFIAGAALAASCAAQVVGTPGSFQEPPGASQNAPAGQVQPASGPSLASRTPNLPAAAPTPSSPYAASPLLAVPAKPAHITLEKSQLSIQANNSSLKQILDQLAKDAGMSIDGLTRDQRIFGVYGPGNPKEILSELLDGAGYNVLMLGTTDAGTPRDLQLSLRDNAPEVAGQPAVVAQQPDEDDAEDTSANYPPAGEATPHPSVPPPNQPTPNGGVKSPQQLLQELQRMRQQQQQQPQ